MNIVETLSMLVTRDLYERRERRSGRAYYVAFDIGGHALSLRHQFTALAVERDQLSARVAELEKVHAATSVIMSELHISVAELEAKNARLRAQSRTATGSDCYQPWEE